MASKHVKIDALIDRNVMQSGMDFAANGMMILASASLALVKKLALELQPCHFLLSQVLIAHQQ